ncbi:DNA polymerase IV [Canibacter zhoujuaniae]|uniref:DNA polymerase IV n=1 Tax=Canibacter zhoujuaniae TaxID=2708343 RepID=UPI0014242630|nr:DNA polymerase IV [Canibacter zhoujuaniae]
MTGSTPAKSKQADKASILHIDMDAFFVSVELLSRPDLRSKPVAVATDTARSVISTANYTARKYGVGSAMSVAVAKQRCPNLIFIPPDMKKYRDFSRRVFHIFERYTPLVEPLSVDEAFLDVSGAQKLFGTPREVAQKILADIYRETGLTASVGIAATKFVAKIASGINKPNGITEVPADRTLEFLHPLPVSKIWGVGEVTRKKLADRAIHTVGELAVADPKSLANLIGKAQAQHLLNLANGIDLRAVQTERVEKSVSAEQTFERDLTDTREVERALIALSAKVGRRARRQGVTGTTITVKLRWSDFSTYSKSHSIKTPINSGMLIAQEAKQLAHSIIETQERAGRSLALRLLGVRLSSLTPAHTAQPALFESEQDRWQKLDETVDELHEKFAHLGVQSARLLSVPPRSGAQHIRKTVD